MSSVLNQTMPRLNGEQEDLSQYLGKVVVIVNTASKCGLTPQYEGLQALYENYQEQGLVILGFPCNQFGAQEKGGSDEISSFCEINYGVSFPMFEKVEVNGKNAAPLFKDLKEQAKGFLGSRIIKWNFTKFLINRQGEVVGRFAPTDKPEKMEKKIKTLLNEKGD